MDRLAAARLERGRGALEAADDEREEERETKAGSGKEEAGSGAKAEDECGAPCAEPCDECAKPVAERPQGGRMTVRRFNASSVLRRRSQWNQTFDDLRTSRYGNALD
jgi:hypothetical protein